MIKIRVPARYKTALGKDKSVKPAGGGLSHILIPDEYVSLMSAARRADAMYHGIDELLTLAHMYEITLPPEFEEALEVFSSVYISVQEALGEHEEDEIAERTKQKDEEDDEEVL